MINLKEKKYSASDVLSIATLCLFTWGAYNLNTKLIDLQNQITKINNTNTKLFALLQERDKVISNMQSKMGENITNITATPTDAQMKLLENDMTQFYIKAAGVVVAGILVVIIFNKISSAGASIGIKTFLPGSVYKALQDSTPWFQSKKSYTFESTDTSWLVDVINDRNVKINVKQKPDGAYQDVIEYMRIFKQEALTASTTPSRDPLLLSTDVVKIAEHLTTAPEIITVDSTQQTLDIALHYASLIA